MKWKKTKQISKYRLRSFEFEVDGKTDPVHSNRNPNKFTVNRFRLDCSRSAFIKLLYPLENIFHLTTTKRNWQERSKPKWTGGK